MSAALEFLDVIALGRDYLYLAGSLDSQPAHSQHARLIVYDEQNQYLWTKHDVNWWNVALSLWIENDNSEWQLCAMSDEGNIEYLCASDDPQYEKIGGAGVHSEDACGWGYMSALKQIGDHLYACGGAGQVYMRRGPGDWVHMDKDILQAPDVSDRLLPRAINGPSESAIYLVGSVSVTGLPPFVFFWNGKSWRDLQLPESAERITNIYVESEERIWMCGANGTLLLGNAQDGFRNLSSVEDNQLFLSLCKFQEKIYLGSNLGLFVYDPADHAAGIRKVITDLTPDLQDANIVDSADDVLWSIGPKDIARFDGEHWERIHHPDNPPIGGTTGTP